MKRFLTVSLVALSFFAKAMGCAFEGSDHNYYMFSVFQRECMEPAYLGDIDSYWKRYCGETDNMMSDFYKWNKDNVLTAAKRKGDAKMVAYLTQLNRYITACGSNDAWDYPTKQQLAKRRQTLLAVQQTVHGYCGTALRSQYALLYMRTNMVLGQDKANITYWNVTASKLPQSCWKEAMKNIYARAMLKTGQRKKACDIYASQGDMMSIKWAARNYRNVAGIQAIYIQDANSPTLAYLVQDFVNNYQQTLDLDPKSAEDKEFFNLINAKTIYRNEAQRFITFADKVVAEGKTDAPCLWNSASAMLCYLMGDMEKATKYVDFALSQRGTLRMKDNARAIKLLVRATTGGTSPEFSRYMVDELQWLDSKIDEERKSGKSLVYDNHYTNVKERVVFRALAPLYQHNGNAEMATALYGMMQKYGNDYQAEAAKYLNRAYGSYSDYTCRLDTMSASGVAQYYSFLTASHEDALQEYVCKKVYVDDDFFNDMIGTKYMAEGNFGEAEKYLSKVSDEFIHGQRINFYMSQRSYAVERWFVRQKPKGEEGFLYTDFADTYGQSATNQKLSYCKEMLNLLSEYRITKEGERKCELAYDLAVRYYQASCYGDCWYLTHYGKSVVDSASNGEKDFAMETIKLLREATSSSNLKLKYKATYALAFIPVQPWYTIGYDAQYNEVWLPQPKALQYEAMLALEHFATNHPEAIDSYTTKCDVLKRFSQAR